MDQLKCPREVQYGLEKDDYYRLLGQSKVFISTAVDENFGYCLAEAVTLGCSPVVVHGFSHRELLQLHPDMLFLDDNSAIDKLSKALDHPIDCHQFMEAYSRSVGRILDEMGVYPRQGSLQPVLARSTGQETAS